MIEPPNIFMCTDLIWICFRLFRERKRKENDHLQVKKCEYADTVEKLPEVTLDNKQLEDEKRELEAELNKLQYVKPSAPAISNGYSESNSNNSCSSNSQFSSRVGRSIPLEAEQAMKYRKTEQAWFAKVSHGILLLCSFSACAA